MHLLLQAPGMVIVELLELVPPRRSSEPFVRIRFERLYLVKPIWRDRYFLHSS